MSNKSIISELESFSHEQRPISQKRSKSADIVLYTTQKSLKGILFEDPPFKNLASSKSCKLPYNSQINAETYMHEPKSRKIKKFTRITRDTDPENLEKR